MATPTHVILGAITLVALACGSRDTAMSSPPSPKAAPGGAAQGAMQPAPAALGGPWQRPSDAELKARLTDLQWEVTQENGTEAPFKNTMYDLHEPGLFVDLVSGEPLFASVDKFDSGTGWPSFVRPIDPRRVVDVKDTSHGMTRVEVRSATGKAHLGHVFDDGPAPTGLRYCINAAALRFVPLAELEAAGYGAWRARVLDAAAPLPVLAGATETAVLAGGCFWGMEEILRGVPGVLETEVGYTGGTTADPTYEDLHDGTTGHAESVRIVFDPSRISFAELLEKWFFRMHDPTTKDRQGNDRGSQYRSAIFATTPQQKKTALEVIAKVEAAKLWDDPIVTEVADAGVWTKAEDYHQDYLQKHPDGYTCHYMR